MIMTERRSEEVRQRVRETTEVRGEKTGQMVELAVAALPSLLLFYRAVLKEQRQCV